ncbi:MAG: DUF370 domain-containing protein [Ardenticatenales bacterium]|nr:DUF370 domain-containing protein [Ardenticatenales bacterium]
MSHGTAGADEVWAAGGVVSVGFGAAVAAGRIVAVGNLRSAPVQRVMAEAERHGRLIDLTFGRRARAALFLDSGHVALVGLAPETAVQRWRGALQAGRGGES